MFLEFSGGAGISFLSEAEAQRGRRLAALRPPQTQTIYLD
jgi:hypothetical protein